MRYALAVSIMTVAVLLGGGCSQSASPLAISQTNERSRPIEAPPADMSTAERLGVRMPGAAAAGTGAMPASHPPIGAPAYAWEVPEGWEALETTQFRQGNFRVAGNPDAEAYLSVLPGAAGGELENINRWRRQMGLDPLAEADLAALPTIDMLGAKAHRPVLEGTYHGMSGEVEKGGYKMAGALVNDGGTTVFVKMTGPASVVDAELAHFDALCASVRRNAEAGATAGTGAAVGMPPTQGSAGAGQAVGGFEEAALHWKAPEGWTQTPDRPMRVVTFAVGTSGKSECYVSVLSGAAGGVEANINRWRQQLGQEPMSAADIAALPTVELMGQAAPLVEAHGTYTGMSGGAEAGYMLLGTVVSLDQRTVFVKMTGPEAEVAAEREHFTQFCTSLH